MPFIPDAQPVKTGFIPDKVQKPQREGVGKWFFGDRTSAPGMALEAGSNILNLPSYVLGGMMDEFQQKGAQAFNPLKNPFGIAGALSGIKNKEAVFRELPESLGIDPNSGAGVAVGFAGELLTPGLPIGKVSKLANVFRGGKAASRLAKPSVFAKVGQKLAGISEDAGNTLLMKSYKLNASDINKIAESIGVTNESEKAAKVLQYLEGLGLKGSTRSSAQTLDTITDTAQKAYDKMVRTGKTLDRQAYVDALFNQASDLEKTANDPNSRMVVQKLLDEAERQQAYLNHGVPMTDTLLTNTKTKAFEAASPGQISNPFETGFNEQIGRAGVRALDTYSPGSAASGTKLRGLRTAQEVVGKQARTGLGTQLINAFKPATPGFLIGAGAGYSQDQNPFLSGVVGGLGAVGLNNPRTLNVVGKTLSGNVNPAVRKVFSAGSKVAGKSIVTGARIGAIPQYQQTSQNKQSSRTLPTPTTNSKPQTSGQPKINEIKNSSSSGSIIPPKKNEQNVFSNKSTFGSTKQVKKGSFY